MRIVCSPDSFKESITARAAAEAMARGARAVLGDAAEIDLCPIADGGEGTVEALVSATGGEERSTRVMGPMGEPVAARWGVLGTRAVGAEGASPHPRRLAPPASGSSAGLTAVIEMAAASGLHLVPAGRRDPERATTFGTGELIRAALDAGATRIILGIGGSATCDGGAGAAQALGVRFFDREGRELATPAAGGSLHCVARIDVTGRDARLDGVELLVACDVTNPLTGPDGAAAVYGPQKGATPEAVERLDAGLRNYASVLRGTLGSDIEHLPGAGAAGGLGGGAVGLLGGRMRRGIELVLEAVGFDERVRGADLVLTGEGRMDGQTVSGKAVAGVAAVAQRHGVPVVALVGSVGPGVERVREIGVTSWRVIGEGLSREESVRRAGELMERAAAAAVRGI